MCFCVCLLCSVYVCCVRCVSVCCGVFVCCMCEYTLVSVWSSVMGWIYSRTLSLRTPSHHPRQNHQGCWFGHTFQLEFSIWESILNKHTFTTFDSDI